MKRVICLVLAVALAAALALAAYVWQTADSIERAALQTEWLLLKHRFVDRTPALVEWLNAYHGEAPGHQVMLSFARWCVKYPERAIAVLSRVPLPLEDVFVRRIAWGVVDAERTEDFFRAVPAGTSPATDMVLVEIRRLQARSSSNAAGNDHLAPWGGSR